MSAARNLRFRWTAFLLVWVLLAAAAGAVVVIFVKPTYTASGYAKVEPPTAILFPDVDFEQQQAGHERFLNTQVAEITSSSILNCALSDPMLRSARDVNCVEALRNRLTVTVVPRSYLIRVDVTDTDRDAAVAMVQAVLRAYHSMASGKSVSVLAHRRSVLEAERSRLRNGLEIRQKDLYELARASDTGGDTSFEAVSATLQKSLEAAHIELVRADAEVIQLEAQLIQLRESPAPVTQPSEDLAVREQALHDDPTIRQLREVLAANEAEVARKGSTDQTREVETRTREMLEKALARVSAETERKLAERQKALAEQAEAKATQQLELARHRRRSFQDRISQQQKRGLDVGRINLEMKRLKDQTDSISRDYKVVDEALGKMEIETRRPDRITVDDSAEVLPDGVTDQRPLLAGLSSAGIGILSLVGVMLTGVLGAGKRSVPEADSVVRASVAQASGPEGPPPTAN